MAKKEFEIRHGLISGSTIVIDSAGNWVGNTIPETKGGTAQTTYAAGDILYASGVDTLAKLTAGGNGRVLTLTGGVPTWELPTGAGSPGSYIENIIGGDGITVTTGSPQITVAVDTTVARMGTGSPPLGNAGTFRIVSAGSPRAYAEFSHDGKDFNTDFSKTDQWNVTGTMAHFSSGAQGGSPIGEHGFVITDTRSVGAGDNTSLLKLNGTYTGANSARTINGIDITINNSLANFGGSMISTTANISGTQSFATYTDYNITNDRFNGAARIYDGVFEQTGVPTTSRNVTHMHVESTYPATASANYNHRLYSIYSDLIVPGDWNTGSNVSLSRNYGIYSRVDAFASDDWASYNLYLDNENAHGTHYGLYQNQAGVINYFAGNLGLGLEIPEQALDVSGTLRIRDGGDTDWLDISHDGTNLNFTFENTSDFIVNVPGTVGARTSRMLVQGTSGTAAGEPVFEVNQTVSNGNSNVMIVSNPNGDLLVVDNEGDVRALGSLGVGTGFVIDNDAISGYASFNNTGASNGFLFYTTSSNDVRGSVTMGVGADASEVISTNVNFADLLIRRDITAGSPATNSEAGDLIRLERDVTNTTSTDGNFISWADDTLGELGYVDKDGVLNIGGSPAILLTTTGAAGGLQVRNTLTGTGLERVLTTSDLTSAGSPTDQLHIVGGDGITVTTGSPEATIAVDSTVFRTTDNLNDIADVIAGSPTQGAMLYNDGTNWLKLPIGTQSQVLMVGSPTTAPKWTTDVSVGGGGASLTLSYRFNSSTIESDPGSKRFRVNASSFASPTVTEIYFNDTTDANIDASTLLGFLTQGDRIYIQEASSGLAAGLFEVTAAPTDNVGWWTVPVTTLDSGIMYSNNAKCGVVLMFQDEQANVVAGDGITITAGSPEYVIAVDSTVARDGDNISIFVNDANYLKTIGSPFLDVRGGTGITVAFGSPRLTITNSDPNVDQNLWLNVAADVGGPVAANTTTDTLTIAGGTNVRTNISGDTVTVNMTGSPYLASVTNVVGGDGITVTKGSPQVSVAVDSTVARLTGSPPTGSPSQVFQGPNTFLNNVTFETNPTTVDGTGVKRPVGLGVFPPYEIDTSAVFDVAHSSMVWHVDAGSPAVTFTAPNNSAIEIGTMWQVQNDDVENVTIAQGSPSVTILRLGAGGAPVSGNVLVQQGGIVTVYKYTNTEYWVYGDSEAIGFGSPISADFKGLTDVNLTGGAGSPKLPTTGDTIYYDGTNWVNLAPGTNGQVLAMGSPLLPAWTTNAGAPDQNLWLTVDGDSGSTAANTTTDTLTIAGGTSITTAMSGDTLTITNDDPNVDQNLWLNIASDVGGPVAANTTTDTLTIAGGTNIRTNISGDTVTVNMTGSPFVTIAQTPWTSNIDAAGFDLTDVGLIEADNISIFGDILVGSPIATEQVTSVLKFFDSDGTTEIGSIGHNGNAVPALEIKNHFASGPNGSINFYVDKTYVDAGDFSHRFSNSYMRIQSVVVPTTTPAAGNMDIVTFDMSNRDGDLQTRIQNEATGNDWLFQNFTQDSSYILTLHNSGGDVNALVIDPTTGTLLADFGTFSVDAADFNGVALTTAGAATNFLAEDGTYIVPAGTGDPDQNLWDEFRADTGNAVAGGTNEKLTVAGGTGITTAIAGSPITLTITNSDPNVDQNIWLNMDADSGGPVAANTTSDTFTITGGTSITTSISGDAVTIVNDDPNVDQNLWLNIASDVGGPVAANTTTDTLTIAGGTNVRTNISGDTLTVNMTGSPFAATNVVGGDGITVTTGSPEVTVAVDATVFRTTNTLDDISDVVAGSPTIGAVLYNDGTNWLKLARGTNGQVLTMGSPLLPSWSTTVGLPTSTVDDSMLRADGSGGWEQVDGLIVDSTVGDPRLWINTTADTVGSIDDITVPFAIGDRTASGDFMSFSRRNIQTQAGGIGVGLNINTYGGTVTIGHSSANVSISGAALIVPNGQVRITEMARPFESGIAANGTIWVATETPNELMFTADDTDQWAITHPFTAPGGSWYYRGLTGAPLSSQIRFNNATVLSATTVSVSETNDQGVDVSAWLTEYFVDGATMHFQGGSNYKAWYSFTLSSVSDDGTYRTATITHVDDGGVIPETEERVFISLIAPSAAPNIVGGTGITVTTGSPQFTITNSDPNVDQNLWLNIASDVGGPVAANTTTDTLTIAGGTNIRTNISGDTITVNMTGSPFEATGDPDQNLWLTVAGDSGSTAANITTDTLTIAGGTGITTAMSGDTLTITQDTITLGTNTTGDFVGTITGGTGIDSSGATSGEDTDHTLSVDLGEVTAVIFDPAADYIPLIDGSATGSTQKDQWADIATIIAGSNITATSGVLSVAAPGDPDQNLWLNIAGDVGGPVAANTTTDTLTIAGGNNVRTNISGDTITINMTGSPFTSGVGSPTNVTIDGTQTIVGQKTFAATTIVQTQLQVQESGGGDAITFTETGSAANITTNANNLFISANGGSGDVVIANGSNFQIGSATDTVLFDHDGTDFNTTFTLTDDWNITGLSKNINFGSPILLQIPGSPSFGTGAKVQDGLGNLQPVGFNTMPVYEIDASDTFDLAHAGMLWHKDANAGVTFTCDDDASIPQGATYVVHNDDTEDLTIAEGSGVTIEFLAGGGAPVGGDVTVEQGGIVTVYKYTDTTFWVWGSKEAAAGGAGTVTSVGLTAGTLVDISGTNPITTSGTMTVDVDLSESAEAAYAPGTDYVLFLDGGTSGTAAKESGIDFAAALAGTNITAASGVLSTTGEPDQNLFLNVLSDSGTAVADTTTDTLSILGGTGISTAVSADALTITNDDPNVDQNLWLNIASDVGGPVAANTTTDTLTIAGGNNVRTNISGDTVTINMTGSPFTGGGGDPDQNLWLNIASDVGGPVAANTTTDTLTIAGGKNVRTNISGDTVTVNMTGSPFTGGAGGLPGSPQVVTIDGSQTIVGGKTFNAVTTFNANITMGAGDDIVFPADAYVDWPVLRIWSTSNDAVIQAQGSSTGNDLFIQTNGDGTAKEGIIIRNNFAVELYYNDTLSFQTESYTAADKGTGASVQDGLGTLQPVGFNTMPVYEIDVADTFDLAHAGMVWHKDSGGTISFTVNSDTNIPVGAMYMVHNDDTEDLTIAEGTATIEFLFPGAAPVGGDVTVEQGGIVTVYKYTDAIFWVWGAKNASGAATPTVITVADESSDTTCFPSFFTAATGDLGPKTGTNLTFNSSTGDLSATLIAGITAANLVDLSATEAITGTWTLDGAVTTSDYGTGGRVKDGTDVSRPIGFNTVPVYEIDAADTFDLAHNGMLWHKDAGGAISFTCNNDTTIPQGATYLVHNDDTEDLTIAEGTATIEFLAPGAAPVGGDVTVEQGGIVTVYKYSDAIFWVWGSKSADAAALLSVTDESSDTTCFPVFVTAATGDLAPNSGTNLTFNSSTGLLTATTLTATGNIFPGGQTVGGLKAVTGNYGSVECFGADGSSGTYEGFSIDGRHVYMDDGSTVSGFYNDTDNEWQIQMTDNAGVTLYYNGGASLVTSASGITVTDSVFLDEQAASNGNVAGDGQIWVKNNVPNDLYFTGDSGLEYQVGYSKYRLLTLTTLDNANVTETIGAQHINGVWHKTTTTARTLTLEASSGTNFPVGSQLSIYNRSTTGDLTVTDSATQALWLLDGTTAVDTAGGVTIGPGGYATLIRESSTVSVIMGAGITDP